jgi:hypothetical protein
VTAEFDPTGTHQVTTTPSGRVEVTDYQPDGSTRSVITAPDGTRTVETTPPAGAVTADQPVTILDAEGNLTTYQPDGSQVVLAPDGTWVHSGQHGVIGRGHHETPPYRPATTTVLNQADGTTVVIHPDGTKELWSSNRLVARFGLDGKRL